VLMFLDVTQILTLRVSFFNYMSMFWFLNLSVILFKVLAAIKVHSAGK
jgi:hypothetical protein